MMNLVVSFFCSIAGSLTPGTINLSVLQSGLSGKLRLGQRMALAAGIMEYLYAWLAIRFEAIISSSVGVFNWFKLVAALVLLTLGWLSLRKRPQSSEQEVMASESGGFRKGLLLGVLNPLAMPYWLGMVAYLKSIKLVRLETWVDVHAFLLGVSIGVVSLLMLVNYSAATIQQKGWVRSTRIANVPGYMMLLLGTAGIFIWLYTATWPSG